MDVWKGAVTQGLAITALLSFSAYAEPYVNLVRYEYDALVIDARAAMAQQDYKSAVKHFEKANAFVFHETPNFRLLPELALAYHRLGNKKQAHQYLQRAEIAAGILSRLYFCQETESGFEIVRRLGERTARVVSSELAYVESRMCGAAYDYVYYPEDVDGLKSDTDYLEKFFTIKTEIFSNQ